MRSDTPAHHLEYLRCGARVRPLAVGAAIFMDDVGAVGTGYGVFNKRTGGIEWLSQTGLLVDAAADFISY